MNASARLQLDCATAGVAGCIERMARLVIAAGGHLHPGALIEERGGNLRVRRTSNLQSGEALFRLPADVLVPVGGLSLHSTAGQITGYTGGELLTGTQTALLDQMIELFNLCGKLGQFPAVPGSILRAQPEWLAAIEAIKPDFTPPPAEPAHGLLNTRRIQNTNAANGFAEGQYLMPIMEFLNHRSGAPQFGLGGGAIAIAAWNADDSDECFAGYADQLDPLSLALHYGYADETNLLAHSAPVSIALPGLGRVEVGAAERRPVNLLNVPQVSQIDSPDRTLTLSHLTFDAASPQRSRAVLALVLSAAAHQRGLDKAQTATLLESAPSAVLDANRVRLCALEALAERLAAELPGAREIGQAARIQARNLANVLGPLRPT